MNLTATDIGAQSRTDEMPLASGKASFSTNARRTEVISAIALYCDKVRLAERMDRDQIKNLEGLHRFTVLSKSTIPNAIIRLRQNPRESAGLAVLNLITLLCDNNEGICTLSIKRMAELFGRTERCIRGTIDSLEEDGLLNVERIDGFPNRYWPAVPSSLADLSPSIAWFVDALSTKPAARGRPTKPPERAFPPLSETPGTSVPPISEKTPEREGKNPGTSAHSISLVDISKGSEVKTPSASPAPYVKHCFTNEQHEDEAFVPSNDAASQHGFSKVSARTLDGAKVENIEPEVIPIPLKPVKTAPAKGKGRANGKRERAQRSEQGARLPDDWSLTLEGRERIKLVWGLTEIEVTRIERAFRNYWTSQPGQKGVKLNWGRTLENWIDRDHARVGEEGARPPTARTRPSAEDQLHAAFGERS